MSDKFIIQIWDAGLLGEIEDGADADSLVPILTLIEADEDSAEKAVSILDALIQVSDVAQVRDYWVISKAKLDGVTVGDSMQLAELFHKVEAENA